MSKTTTLTALAAQVEELTKTQNRIREVIRANSISNQGLDPKGIIEMSDSEYAEHRAALQKVSDEFDLMVDNHYNQLSTSLDNKKKSLNEMIERHANEVATELKDGLGN